MSGSNKDFAIGSNKDFTVAFSSSSSSSSSCADKQRKLAAGAVAVAIGIIKKKKGVGLPRQIDVPRLPRNPKDIIKESLMDGLFSREFRMEYDTFHLLNKGLESRLSCKPKNTRSNVASSLTILLIGLRFCAGGSYLDIVRTHNYSADLIYKCIHRFIVAVAESNDIGFVAWPEDVLVAEELSTKFAACSKNGPYSAIFS